MNILILEQKDQKCGLSLILPKKNIVFNENNLDNMRVNLGLSSRKMKKITNFLRSNVGRKSIPSHYSKHMHDKATHLKDIYKKNVYSFECDNKKKEKRPVIYADAESVLDAVIEERKFEGDVNIKLMADGGRGFFKLSLSIFQDNLSEDDDYGRYDNPTISNQGKRNLYSEGGSASKKAKLSSVRRLIILCIVPQIKETYENVKLLFDLTNVNNIPFKFVADFKLLLIINGQQTASALYPCPYCFVSLRSLKGVQEDVANTAECSSGGNNLRNNNQSRLKTFGDLRNDFEKFQTTGRNMKYSQECHSTINSPLFAESDDMSVLEKCVIPELHILMGFVNHLFWTGLVPLLGRDTALIWPTKLKLISRHYHGEAFEGNACRKLLKEADKLNDPDIYGKVGYFKIVPYLNAFKIMNEIVDCSFSSRKIQPNLGDLLRKLDKALEAIEYISVTLKIHVLKSHIQECLQYIPNDRGLGYWSEQSGESLHHEFMKTWERYKMNTINDELYIEKLFDAVVEFSSLNL